MSYQKSLAELTDFLLKKFHHPNIDMRYLGGSSSYAQTERDMRRVLNSLQGETSKTSRLNLLSQLEGHAFVMNTVSYYSNEELDEIIDKINSVRKELPNGKDI